MTPRRWLAQPLRSRWRGLVALAALVAAAAHVPVIGPHLEEAPYMGVLFLLLTIACAALAVTLMLHDSAGVYAAAVVLCGTAIVGYAATRIVAFPELADDVGNWLEPLGVLAVLSEATAVVAALAAAATPTRREK
jgi:hypothetical protein